MDNPSLLPSIEYDQYLQLTTDEVRRCLLNSLPWLRVSYSDGNHICLQVAPECPNLYHVRVVYETTLTDADVEGHPLGMPYKATTCFEWNGVSDLDAAVRQFNILLENAHYDG